MTAVRVYDRLHHMVDRLTPSQAHRLLRFAQHDPELAACADEATEAAPVGETQDPRPLASAGIFDSGRGDLAERVDELVAERFNHSM
jgi:hypothetical protein